MTNYEKQWENNEKAIKSNENAWKATKTNDLSGMFEAAKKTAPEVAVALPPPRATNQWKAMEKQWKALKKQWKISEKQWKAMTKQWKAMKK